MAERGGKRGSELNEKWGVGARHSLYRETGDWYHVPKHFPAALFDAHGYVRFETLAELQATVGVSTSTKKGKDWLTVKETGIKSLRAYVRKDSGGSPLPPPWDSNESEGVGLRTYDESERLCVRKSGTVRYRTRHKKITNALCERFSVLKPEQGHHGDNEYDVLLRNYDREGRDLLVEVKPDPDRGSLRIAIGQLYDYRRLLRNRAKTDLAVLTIGRPNDSYMDLLTTLGITSLWFEGDNCGNLSGASDGWPLLATDSGVRNGNPKHPANQS